MWLLVARRIEVSGEPCATGFGDFVFVTDISAPSRWIVKVAVPLLLLLTGSLVALLAMATELSLSAVERRLVPRGIRLQRTAGAQRATTFKTA